MAAVRLPDTGHLVLHRIVAKSDEGWLVKGDNCFEADGVVPELALLGRVVKVERRGKRVFSALGASGIVVAWLNRGQALRLIRSALTFPVRLASRVASGLFGLLQSAPAYRRIGRFCARGISLSLADESLLERIHDRANPWQPYRHRPASDDVENWVAMRGDAIAGFARYAADSGSGTGTVVGVVAGHRAGWIRSLYVYPRYRALGIGGKLLDRLVESSKARGDGELRIIVAEGDRRTIELCAKKGFFRETRTDSGKDPGEIGGIPAVRSFTMTMAMPG